MLDEPAREKINPQFAGYVFDAVEHLTRITETMKYLRWRIHRGEQQACLYLVEDMRRDARKFMRDLEMCQHCLEEDKS